MSIKCSTVSTVVRLLHRPASHRTTQRCPHAPPVCTSSQDHCHRLLPCLHSALRDSRFAPIRLKEVPQLSCGVSLLRLFEAASSHLDWTVGTHGLICEFQDPVRRCKRSATFLPEVAAEQGWSKLQCIDALIRKSGAV